METTRKIAARGTRGYCEQVAEAIRAAGKRNATVRFCQNLDDASWQRGAGFVGWVVTTDRYAGVAL